MIALFAANLALNVAWSVIFFQAQAPELAGVVIIVLLVTIFALGWLMWPYDRIAAVALVPYAGWVAFASVLTWSIAASS